METEITSLTLLTQKCTEKLRLRSGPLLEISFTKVHHMHFGATGNRTQAPKSSPIVQTLILCSVDAGQEGGSGLRFGGTFYKHTGIFMCAFFKLVCLQATWWKHVSAFGLYCDFFSGPLYTGSIKVYSRFKIFFVLIRVNKDLPRPNFLALGLRSYRRYKKHINYLTYGFKKDSKTLYIFFS